MSRHDILAPDDPALRAVGRAWRAAGVAVVFLAAIVLIVAKVQGAGLHAPLMIAGFAILALGWILAFIGIFIRTRRLRKPE